MPLLRAKPTPGMGKTRARNCAGSGILMSISGVSLLTAILVGGTALIAHIGAATYYHDKLEFIARQGAAHAVGELSWAGAPRDGAKPDLARQKAINVVNDLLSQMGFPGASNIDVTLNDDGVAVNLSVTGLAMPRGTVLPNFIDLDVSSEKKFEEDRPPEIVLVRLDALAAETTIAIPAMELSHSTRKTMLPHQPAPHPTVAIGSVGVGYAQSVPLCKK